MAAKVNALEQRKEELLARSHVYRQSLEAEFRDIRTATAWVPKSVKVVRAVYPILLLAAPLLGYVFGRKRLRHNHRPSKGGILASALAGYRLVRQFKPVWDGLRSW